MAASFRVLVLGLALVAVSMPAFADNTAQPTAACDLLYSEAKASAHEDAQTYLDSVAASKQTLVGAAKFLSKTITDAIRDEAEKLDKTQAERAALIKLREKARARGDDPASIRELSGQIITSGELIAVKSRMLSRHLKEVLPPNIQQDVDHTQIIGCMLSGKSQLTSGDALSLKWTTCYVHDLVTGDGWYLVALKRIEKGGNSTQVLAAEIGTDPSQLKSSLLMASVDDWALTQLPEECERGAAETAKSDANGLKNAPSPTNDPFSKPGKGTYNPFAKPVK